MSIHRSRYLVFFGKNKRQSKKQQQTLPTGLRKRPAHSSQSWLYFFESMFFYAITAMIFAFIFPKTIADFPLSGAFLLLHLPLFMANSLLLLSLLRNGRQTVVLALTFQTIVFLKLQMFVLTPVVLVAILLIPGLMIVFDLYNRRHL